MPMFRKSFILACAAAGFVPGGLGQVVSVKEAGRFDLSNRNDVLELWKVAGEQADGKQVREIEALPAATLANLPAADLKKYYRAREIAAAAKREQRGWRETEALCGKLLQCDDREKARRLRVALGEMAEAIPNESGSPVPPRVDVTFAWETFWRYARHPIGRGVPPAESGTDRRQPPASSFWTPPVCVAKKDLYAGFGRGALPDYDAVIWTYAAPKTSAGAHPGFTIKAGEKEVKVKFGEEHSEPFASRIFDALGYHVTAIDYAPRLRVRYDRRLFREFHQRQDLRTRLQLFGFLPLYTIQYQRRFDPFAFVVGAVLRDGRRISAGELRKGLFPRAAQRKHPEDDPANFDPVFEGQVDFLVTLPANVEQKVEAGDAAGRWSFGGLDHEERRELRGLGLLAAWVCWFDVRPANTRLRIMREDGEIRLVHWLTDLGGVLGKSKGFMSSSWQKPSDFSWRFTAPESSGERIRIIGYQPVEPVPAFRRMDRDDARWMARWIGQLSKKQITDALRAAGFDKATTKIYADKLIARRDHMIRDLGLAGEIPPLHKPGKGVQEL